MSEWNTVPFESLYLIPSRNGLSKPSKVRGSGYKMINMGELFANDRIYDIPMELVPLNEKEKINAKVEENDLLFARQSLVEAGAGKCSIVIETSDMTVFESHLIRVRLDTKLADPLFYYYYFKSGISQMRTIVTRGVQSGIKASDLAKLSVIVPHINIQRGIAEFLQTIDKKIEINNQINRNLSEQAFALFDQMYVSHNSEDLGNLSELAEINPKRTIVKNVEARCIDMAKLSTTGPFPDGWEYKPYTGGMKFINGDTLLARITPCLENGKTSFVNFLNDGETAFGSTEYVVLASKGATPPEMLYCLARYPKFVDYAVKNMNGSSGRQRVSGETIGQYQIPLFSNDELIEFGIKIKGFFEAIKQNSLENMRLVELRDGLLPKLMSGELNVSELEF